MVASDWLKSKNRRKNREGISLCGMAVLLVLVALNNKGGRGLSRVFVASALSRAPEKTAQVSLSELSSFP